MAKVLIIGASHGIGLETVKAALRAGHSLASAMSVVADEAPEPSAREFTRVVTDEQLGIPLDEALEVTAKRMQNVDMDQVAVLALVPLIGSEVNGAQRWLHFGPIQVQPSEFLKPLFVVALAWLLSLRSRDAALPVVPLSGVLLALVAFLLMKQPDFGSTIIFCSVWIAMLALAGVAGCGPIRPSILITALT